MQLFSVGIFEIRPCFDCRSVGFDRRSGGTDRRSARFDHRSASFDRRSASFDRRRASFDRRSAGFDSRNAAFDRRSTSFYCRSTARELLNSIVPIVAETIGTRRAVRAVTLRPWRRTKNAVGLIMLGILFFVDKTRKEGNHQVRFSSKYTVLSPILDKSTEIHKSLHLPYLCSFFHL